MTFLAYTVKTRNDVASGETGFLAFLVLK